VAVALLGFDVDDLREADVQSQCADGVSAGVKGVDFELDDRRLQQLEVDASGFRRALGLGVVRPRRPRKGRLELDVARRRRRGMFALAVAGGVAGSGAAVLHEVCQAERLEVRRHRTQWFAILVVFGWRRLKRILQNIMQIMQIIQCTD